MPASLTTPPPDQLRAYLLGKLPPDEFSRVDSWVESNPYSGPLLGDVDARDGVTAALATPCPVALGDRAIDSVVLAGQTHSITEEIA
jgi:hypothetical protein